MFKQKVRWWWFFPISNSIFFSFYVISMSHWSDSVRKRRSCDETRRNRRRALEKEEGIQEEAAKTARSWRLLNNIFCDLLFDGRYGNCITAESVYRISFIVDVFCFMKYHSRIYVPNTYTNARTFDVALFPLHMNELGQPELSACVFQVDFSMWWGKSNDWNHFCGKSIWNLLTGSIGAILHNISWITIRGCFCLTSIGCYKTPYFQKVYLNFSSYKKNSLRNKILWPKNGPSLSWYTHCWCKTLFV